MSRPDEPERRGESPGPKLGVILLDAGYPVPRFEWGDPRASSDLPPGFASHPASWGTDVTFAVATDGGAGSRAEVVSRAAASLAQDVDFITSDCGFMRATSRGEVGPPMLIGTADLLPMARSLGSSPMVLTTNEQGLRDALGRDAEALIIVEVVGAEWQRFGNWRFGSKPPLDVDQMRDELIQSFDRAVDRHGAPGVLVLSCTAMPQFRSSLRERYRGPILDVPTLVRAILDLDPCEQKAKTSGAGSPASATSVGAGEDQ